MIRTDQISGRQIAAARALLGMGQSELAARSNISVPTLKRMEASEGPAGGMPNNVAAVRAALEAAGVEFTNGGQQGVRLAAAPSGAGGGALEAAEPPAERRPTEQSGRKGNDIQDGNLTRRALVEKTSNRHKP